MTFDVSRECTSILGLLPDTLPDHSSPNRSYASDLPEFLKRAESMLTALQQEFPSLADKKLGGLNRLYAYDPATYIATLERDVVAHWLRHPESLELGPKQTALAASHWYDRPVTEHRIKRRFRDPDLTQQLQTLCYEPLLGYRHGGRNP